jgi:type 1 glutamine amidotransferase
MINPLILSHCFALLLLLACASANALAADPWFSSEAGNGPGKGKHIVMIAAEEAYRSEESMPMMAQILSRQGFKCTVLFAIDPADGTINPKIKDNIPGLEQLKTADLLVAFLRWRELPDEQMQHIIDYTESGKPILGIRNATHPFKYVKRPDSPYARFDSASKEPSGGWGRLVLGETWISHYGKNLVESTRCDIVTAASAHPIFKGIRTGFWIPDDVYGISSALSGDSTPVLLGQPLDAWTSDARPVAEKPPQPIAWTKSYTGAAGKKTRVFTSTMGHGDAFKIEAFRRMISNACLWCMNMEDSINPSCNMDIPGEYNPGPAGANGIKPGVLPQDLKK